jgi:hypothetical protein
MNLNIRLLQHFLEVKGYSLKIVDGILIIEQGGIDITDEVIGYKAIREIQATRSDLLDALITVMPSDEVFYCYHAKFVYIKEYNEHRLLLKWQNRNKGIVTAYIPITKTKKGYTYESGKEIARFWLPTFGIRPDRPSHIGRYVKGFKQRILVIARKYWRSQDDIRAENIQSAISRIKDEIKLEKRIRNINYASYEPRLDKAWLREKVKFLNLESEEIQDCLKTYIEQEGNFNPNSVPGVSQVNPKMIPDSSQKDPNNVSPESVPKDWLEAIWDEQDIPF